MNNEKKLNLDNLIVAIEYWQQRTREDTKNGELYVHVATLQGDIGNHFSKCRHYEQAIKHSPRDPSIRSEYGLALFKQGKEAERQLKAALQSD